MSGVSLQCASHNLCRVKNSDTSGRAEVVLGCKGLGELGFELIIPAEYPQTPCCIILKNTEFQKRGVLRGAAHEYCVSHPAGSISLAELCSWLSVNSHQILCEPSAGALLDYHLMHVVEYVGEGLK